MSAHKFKALNGKCTSHKQVLTRHMSHSARNVSFAVLSLTKFENSWCSCDFLEVSQEAKVAPSFSAWPLCCATMLFGHMGHPENAKKLLLPINYTRLQ